jgi:hypothetical protein
MRTASSVDARVSEAKPFDRHATDQMTLDDLGDVGFRDAAVPHGVGIHDDRRTVLALIEAAGFIGAHAPLQLAIDEGLFESLLQPVAGVGIARAARVAGLTLVVADEDVSLEWGHAGLVA